ncbi:unnamed protein product [Caenorhabditis bovis]|uniref:CX domain-containing protein n=1 Tax=Caenorhabditis bovis TaxID=2654633 RepID=A0A8S1EB42_9PELO|nr:unnamed protein product [Caenorhabditis bovis]
MPGLNPIYLIPLFGIITTIALVDSQRLVVSRPLVMETHLTGSEFEESFIRSLINSTQLDPIDEEVSLLLYGNNISYTIVDPATPFDFIDRNYYWSTEAFDAAASQDNSTKFTWICVYNISDDDKFFTEIEFSNGSRLESITFGCENGKECCGLKCCGDDVLINIIIVGAISIALLLLLLCNILIGFKKRREGRKSNAAVVYGARQNDNTIEIGEEIDANQITLQTRHVASSPTRDRTEIS